MNLYQMGFVPNKVRKKPFPKVASDGQVLGDTPYYVYVCSSKSCTWEELWTDKQDAHKCACCGQVMIRVANPKQVLKELRKGD